MIYIVCPWGNATGGTELLHQLGNVLNNLGFEACMYYILKREGFVACCPQFEKYNVKRAEYLLDKSGDIVVFPELIAKHLDSFDMIKNSKKILWWMSVDNAELSPEEEKKIVEKKEYIHFVQSYYAKDYVLNHLCIPDDNVFYVSDYIGTRFLNMPDNTNRQNIILFNPRKGFDKTSELIRYSNGSVLWRALEGINGDEMPRYLLNAKVYIDFGNHPGKDRFPREAVACGCRVLTGKRGAAAYYNDVMLPAELKIEDEESAQEILKKIYSLIENYDTNGNLYEEYNKCINEEFHVFEVDVLKAFNIITGQNIELEYGEISTVTAEITKSISSENYKNAFRKIVEYRCKYQETINEFSEEFLLLECYVRLGIGQYEIAEYMINNIIKKNAHNYEAYILLAETLICNLNAYNRLERAAKAIEKSLEYSKETDDFGIIEKRAVELISNIKSEMET